MKLYNKKFLINGNCMIRSFGQPGDSLFDFFVLSFCLIIRTIFY